MELLNHSSGLTAVCASREQIESFDLLHNGKINAVRTALLQLQGQRREIRSGEPLISIADIAFLLCAKLRRKASN